VILTHGEENARHHLETSLRQRLHAEVYMPDRGDTFDLQRLRMTNLRAR
jgi:predicted metal-dependent RNase